MTITRDDLTRILPVKFGASPTPAHTLIHAAVAWPEPIELPAPITAAIELARVVKDATPPAVAPLDPGAFAAGKYERWVAATVAAERFADAKAVALGAAIANIYAAVDTNAGPLYDALDASLATAWADLVARDVYRIAGTDPRQAAAMGSDALEAFTAAGRTVEIVNAASDLARALARPQHAIPGANHPRIEGLLVGTPAGQVKRWRDGFDINGATPRASVAAWSAACGFRPSICRSPDDLRARASLLGRAGDTRPDWTPEQAHNRDVLAPAIAAAAGRLAHNSPPS